MSVPVPLPEQRALFEIPDEVAYFNCAAITPQLRSVRLAGEQALARRAAPWTIGIEDWFEPVEELRALVARLIGGDADGVAIVPSTSYALAVAAHNIPAAAGDRVLVLDGEFPSSVLTWRAWAERGGAEVLTVERAEGEGWTDAVLRALDERVSVVSVPNVHWTDGGRVDVLAVGARAREVGARFVVDATQSLGAMELDVSTLRPDYLVTAGYKWLLGPFGVSYLWVAEEHRDGEPLEENWINRAGAEDFAGLTDPHEEYLPGARRFDVGQRSNFVSVPMATAALRQLHDWGVGNLSATLAATTEGIERAARERGLECAAASQRGPHMLGISLPAERRAAIAAQMARDNVFAAIRGSVMRVSPHLHVVEADVARLFGALDRALG